MDTKPPFSITAVILDLSSHISHTLGFLSGARLQEVPVQLRRENSIKTVQASLAIEGNALTVDQVSALFDGKRVIGHKKDILEVQNALNVYAQLSTFSPLSVTDFKKAHAMLMHSLIEKTGIWRTTGVAVFKGQEIAHVAPPALMVTPLMEQLFDFLQQENSLSWIIKAAVFHYELEFIHPFIDGNGRMGRLWQQRILMQQDPIFEFICTDPIIKDHQQDYYDTLAACDKAADSTLFIEFSLRHILTALQQYTQSVS
jgi:Fic family protein